MVSLELEARLDNLLVTAQTETAEIDLFAPIQERDECPICLIPLPLVESEITFQSCCGKHLCNGCIFKYMVTDVKNKVPTHKQKCAFCRQPPIQTAKDGIKSLKRLMKKNNPSAFMAMAREYKSGENVIKSDTKAVEMFIHAAELGDASAFVGLGFFYKDGIAVERDISKSIEFHKVGAKNGSIIAHEQLALFHGRIGNVAECIKHLKLIASAGDKYSMDKLMTKYKQKLLSKEDLTQTLRAYQASSNAMKSKDREAASKVLGEFAMPYWPE